MYSKNLYHCTYFYQEDDCYIFYNPCNFEFIYLCDTTTIEDK